jgi:hypothetical protein
MSQVTKSVIYKSENTPTDISISVEIGYAQPSVTTIFVDGKQLNRDIKNSFNQKVGNANELRGKEVVCFTTVSDIQPTTNETSLKIKIFQGTGVLDVPTLRLNANEGEVVFYKLTIIIL